MSAIARALERGRYDGEIVTFELRAPRATFPGDVRASLEQRELRFTINFSEHAGIAMAAAAAFLAIVGIAEGSLLLSAAVFAFTMAVWIGLPMLLTPLALRRRLRKIIRRFVDNPRTVYPEG